MPIVKNSDSYTVIKKQSMLTLLDRPIAFHRCFVDLTRKVAGALLLSQAIYWQRRCESKDGWWWKTAEDWLEETGLHRKEFESARRSCAPFLQHERRDIPAKCYYRVDLDEVQSRLSVLDKQVCPKWTNRYVQNGQSTVSTETSSETSSETSFEQAMAGVPIFLRDQIGKHTDFAKMVFESWDSVDGKNGNGVSCRFEKLLKKRWNLEGEQWRAGCHSAQKQVKKKPDDVPYYPGCSPEERKRARDNNGPTPTA